MKFYDIMYSKNNLAIAFAMLCSTVGFTQKGTESPYSVFGIGELNQGQYAAFMAMGGISMACSDSTIVGSNPASYAYFNRNRPVFQMGVNARLSNFITTTDSTFQSTFGLNQIQLGIPIKKRWGAGFGLMPYSFTGYTVANYIITAGDTTHQAVNEGSGAVSRVYLGLGYTPVNFSYPDTNWTKKDSLGNKAISRIYTRQHMISVGVNGNYLFGSSSRLQSYEYVDFDYAYNSRVKNSLRITDGYADFGFNYQYFFRPVGADSLMNGSVSIGASYTPGFQLRAYQDLISYTYLGSFYGNSQSQTYVVDTIEDVSDNEGSIYIPEQYKLGMEYRFGWQPSRRGERMLRIGAEVNFQKWSTFYEDFGGAVSTSPYRDRLGLGVGLEYSPVISSDPAISILARTNYRLGFNYTQTELSVNGTNLDNYGMSFGLGIPVNINATNTNINLGATLGRMGTTSSGLIQENYIGFYFGISIMPGKNELWFEKRKYD
jgi:hypothetical protein